jgi:hypothetical protein
VPTRLEREFFRPIYLRTHRMGGRGRQDRSNEEEKSGEEKER